MDSVLSRIGMAALLAGCLVLVVVGCTTTSTTAPDGTTTVTRAMDAETAVAMAQLALTSTEQAFDMWLQYQEAQTDKDAAAYEAEKALRQERIENLKTTLAALIEAKAALQAQVAQEAASTATQ